MKKFYILILALFLVGNCGVMAQNPVVPATEDVEDEGDEGEDDEDDEDDEEGDDGEEDFPDGGLTEDAEITVTDAEGRQEIIDMPETMTYEVDSLLHLYNNATYLQPDTTCHAQDYNPTFDQDVYVDRLRRLPTIMEMPYNEVVRKFIDQYTGRLRRSVSYMLGASNFYMPIFEEALEAYGLPLELRYLPVIESALNPKAVSRVGATGLWQFMLTTGKQYGLKVNSLVDERRDPIKSSYAAARYLSDLYRIFKDWNLVIAAYNCGPAKVNQAIHRAGGSSDYWHIYPYLPKETRGYVPAFIAANYAMTYYCDHNICPMLADLPAKSDTIMVSEDIHFDQIAHFTGVSTEQLRALNPQYRRDIVNGLNEPMILRLPTEALTAYVDHEQDIFSYKRDEYMAKRTVVDVNDEVPTYQRYQARYGTRKPAYRKSGKSTWRKGKGKSYGKGKGKRSKGKSSRGKGRKKGKNTSRSVTVKNGDTLSKIAAKNGTTVAKLKKLNGIKGSTIQKGKKIRVK